MMALSKYFSEMERRNQTYTACQKRFAAQIHAHTISWLMLGVTSSHWLVQWWNLDLKIMFRVGRPSVIIWIPNLKDSQIRLEQLWAYSLEYHGSYSLDISFGIVDRKRTLMKWVWLLRNFQWQFQMKRIQLHFNLFQQQLMKTQLVPSNWSTDQPIRAPDLSRLYSKNVFNSFFIFCTSKNLNLIETVAL